jgi:hypothetical protein
MEGSAFETQRRQFGRRETCTRAIATLPGFGPVACELRNVSEGGALLVFERGEVPKRPFRIEVDGTHLNIFCEVRHAGKHGVGVRFLNQKDGILLIAALYPAVEPVKGANLFTPQVVEADSTVSSISNRDLRDAVNQARIAERLAKLPNTPPRSKVRINDRLRVAVLAGMMAAVSVQNTALGTSMAGKKQAPFYGRAA